MVSPLARCAGLAPGRLAVLASKVAPARLRRAARPASLARSYGVILDEDLGVGEVDEDAVALGDAERVDLALWQLDDHPRALGQAQRHFDLRPEAGQPLDARDRHFGVAIRPRELDLLRPDERLHLRPLAATGHGHRERARQRGAAVLDAAREHVGAADEL